jgi:N-acetylglucosaminyl-diphospho-decaprenol L-rhamnosyltransferase
MLDLAVIIVTWNVRGLVLAALSSLLDDLAASGLAASIIVVDNASSDGTAQAIAEAFPTVDLIASSENLGFVRGNNLALRALGFEGQTRLPEMLPRAVYLLNPDTITQLGATRALFDALFEDPRRGLVGARLTYEDGSFQHSAFSFPGLRQLWAEFFPTPGRWIEGRFNGRYPKSRYEAGVPFEVDAVLGATMMLRRETILSTGLFDETFFMYCEELDWARRIWAAGWSVCCVPSAHVVHLGGQSAGQVRPLSLEMLWRSRLYLIQKHYPAWKAMLARLLIRVGMARKRRQLANEPLAESERAALDQAYAHIQQMAAR